MKNKFKLLIAVFAVTLLTCAVFAPQAHATAVSGAINFQGSVTLNNTSAGNSTTVTAWSGLGQPGNKPQVAGSSGSFAAFAPPGSAVDFFAPWSFNSTSIPGFWKVGGFTFNLTSSAMLTQGFGPGGLGFVTAGGTGTITGNGFDSTQGTWSFSTQDPGTPNGNVTTFSFSAGTNALPEGGTTLALLGSALVCVEVIRRKLAAA